MNSRLQRSLPRWSVTSRTQNILHVLVAVPDQLDRESLVALLGTVSGLRVVGEAATAAHAIELCQRHTHHVLIVDLSMAGTGRESAIATILRQSPETRVVAVAPHNSEKCWLLNARARTRSREGNGSKGAYPPCLRMAFAEGASGGIQRSDATEDLANAVRHVAAGQPWLDPQDLRELAVTGNGDGATAPELSARERQVAVLVSDGLSNKEIGRVLGISETTVKKHISHLLRKISVEDRLQLGLYVVRCPLLFQDAAASTAGEAPLPA